MTFHPLTPGRWDDLKALFGPRGACGGCWCMWWRRTRPEWEKGKGDGNRRALRKIVNAGEAPGLLAYEGDKPVGWVAVAPRERYVRLATSRVLAPVDAQPVWSIVCLYVARPYRGKGLMAQLVAAAAEYAAKRGARIVEGYPVEPARRTADAFLYTGVVSSFRAAGFEEALRRSPARPIMRRRPVSDSAATPPNTPAASSPSRRRAPAR